MTRLFPLALCALVACPPAMAQSQLARSVLPDLRRAGVSEACLSKLSEHDFAVAKGILESGRHSPGWKLHQAKFQARKGCGETRSILFDIFGVPAGR
ncbi:hypothetical protein RGUI_3526 [Rhodovulum sp. P5]|uniref:hypothetical protein n=1 Tax=Rhodovulum sp. P5 TaxID=1564506 RepID=UPI0009C3D37A|nr:hypothetical protein [Rhodovulum sp. P5]ARE41667.1 hypothetical protein RGUI_3526 [Rhodovulum sp. P5]